MAMVTLEEIARMAGVSKATVSRVFNDIEDGVGEDTRKKVQQLINELGYGKTDVIHKIPRMRTKTIALILPDLTNPFYQNIIDPIEDHAYQRGYTVILGSSRFSTEKEANYIRTFITKRVDGIILVTLFPEETNYHRILEKYDIPCILLDRKLPGKTFRAGVYIDNESPIYDACEYFIKQGNKRIVFLGGPKEISTASERKEGYLMALKQYSIEYDPKLVRHGDFTIKSGYDCIMQLVSENVQFNAVMASSDTMAIGALTTLKSIGRKVPEEVEIIGFDNIDFCEHVTPALSTISQPIYEIGKIGAKLLFDLIDGKKLKEPFIKMKPQLIFRGTTKRMGTDNGNTGDR